MSISYDIATIIQQRGFGIIGETIGVNAYMDKGDNEIAVFNFSGRPPTFTHGYVVAFEHPKMQIQVRNRSNQLAEDIAWNIYRSLRGNMDLSVNGHEILSIAPHKDPNVLEKDEHTRSIWMFEFEVERRPE